MALGGGLLALLAVAIVWLWLRKPKKKAVTSTAHRPVSKPASRSAGSAELPTQTPAISVPAAPVPEKPALLAALQLEHRNDVDASVLARVETVCESMADPHPVQSKLAGGLDTPEELIEVVASDAGLTASILRTVNSAAFALTSPITSVQHAITYLGISVVKGLVAQAAVAERVAQGTAEQEEALTRIWRSACAASAVAQALGHELGVSRPSVLATKSLFFNLGDVAIVNADPAAAAWYRDGVSIVERIQSQQEAGYGNTAIVGAELSRRWNLPEDIASAIEHGLMPLVTPPSEHPMSGDDLRQNVLVYLAGRVGDRVVYRGLRDVADLELQGTQEPGLFYLAAYLEKAGMERALGLLQEPTFRRKINRLLQTLAQ